jgi:hypothetical protein
MNERKFPVVKADPQTKVTEDEGVVWMSCRASEKCEGTHAKIARKWKGESGGAAVRYVCTTCNKPFHINF